MLPCDLLGDFVVYCLACALFVAGGLAGVFVVVGSWLYLGA